jgi:hypothetical protein
MTATKKTTTELRRCTGSARFGIEPHDAPITDFPKQPSRKDGLGTMCREHWKAYVKGLTADRKARAVALMTDTGEAVPLPKTAAKKVDTAIARAAKPKRAPAAKPAANADAVAEAEALIAEVDAMAAPEALARIGDPDVQAAFELAGEAESHGRGADTSLDGAIDADTEESDAA